MMYTMDSKRLEDSKKQKEKEIDTVLETIKKTNYATLGTLGQISGLQKSIIDEKNTFNKTNKIFITNYITKKQGETEDKERIAKLEKLQQKQDFWNGTSKKELIMLDIKDILPKHKEELSKKNQMVNNTIIDTRTKEAFKSPKILLDPILGKADIIEETNYEFRKIFFNILLNKSKFPTNDNSLKYNLKGELITCDEKCKNKITFNETGKPLPTNYTLSVDVENKEAYYIKDNNPEIKITTIPMSGGRRKTKYRRSYAHRFTIKHRGKN